MRKVIKNKGFTLIELLVVCIVVLSVSALIYSASGCGRVSDAERRSLIRVWGSHEQRKANAQEEQADELRRANDLRERELRLRERELQNNR